MMKSIVEEASSIEKAITSAWDRAGKPKKFTITIFQEPEKNFFGMTKAPAKIGFMFEERAPKSQKPSTHRPQQKTDIKHAPQVKQAHKKEQKQAVPQQQHHAQDRDQKNINRFWSQEMVDAARNWLAQALELIDKKSVSFSAKPSRYHLKIQFSEPLSADEKKQKNMFRSLAHLVMQAQRAQFKKALKHHKVILSYN